MTINKINEVTAIEKKTNTNMKDIERRICIELAGKTNEDGKVSYEDMIAAISRHCTDPDQALKFYDRFDISDDNTNTEADNGAGFYEDDSCTDDYNETDRASIPQFDACCDSVKMYLKEIGSIPTLSAEREKELALRIIEGDKKARDEFIDANLRLCANMAKKYSYLNKADFLDHVQNANIGLINAVDRFDPNLGFRFSTYATYWIRQAILRSYAETANLVRLPAHVSDTISRIKKFSRNFLLKNGREPNEKEIAKALDMTPSKVLNIKSVGADPVFLETPLGEDGDGCVGDLIADTFTLSPEEQAEANDLVKDVATALSKLSDREAQVLRYRYGLDGKKDLTLAQVGLKMGITRERVRQIEVKALRKLRRSNYIKSLESYVS